MFRVAQVEPCVSSGASGTLCFEWRKLNLVSRVAQVESCVSSGASGTLCFEWRKWNLVFRVAQVEPCASSGASGASGTLMIQIKSATRNTHERKG
jgi:hypothetical protein